VEIVGLLAPTVRGKSTAIKLILGLLFPTSGGCFVFDQTPANPENDGSVTFPRILSVQVLDRRRNTRFLRNACSIWSAADRREPRQTIESTWSVLHGGGEGAQHRGSSRSIQRDDNARVRLAQAPDQRPDLICSIETTTGLDDPGTREMKT